MHKYAFFNFQSLIDFDVYKNITILILSIIFDASDFFSLQYLQCTQNSHKKIFRIHLIELQKKNHKKCVFLLRKLTFVSII